MKPSTIDVPVRPVVHPAATFTAALVLIACEAAALIVTSPVIWLAVRAMEWAVAP